MKSIPIDKRRLVAVGTIEIPTKLEICDVHKTACELFQMPEIFVNTTIFFFEGQSQLATLILRSEDIHQSVSTLNIYTKVTGCRSSNCSTRQLRPMSSRSLTL
jgi:hypothetical protein